MGFYDGKGVHRNFGDRFYDSEGVLRNPGDRFYDGRGVLRNSDDQFYDSEGILRTSGHSYYDSAGRLVTPPVTSSSDTSSYYGTDSGGGGGNSFAYSILVGAGIIIGIALAIYLVFSVWYYAFAAVESAGDILYVSTLIISIIITSIFTYVKVIDTNSYLESAITFGIMNSIVTYVGIVLSSIVLGEVDASFIFGGAFLSIIISVVPAFLMTAILYAISYIYIRYKRKKSKNSFKQPNIKVLHKIYEEDKTFKKVVNQYAKEDVDKLIAQGKFNMIDAYNKSYKIQLTAYKYLKKNGNPCTKEHDIGYMLEHMQPPKMSSK